MPATGRWGRPGLLIALLFAEGLHRPDAGHRLDELHDQSRREHTGRAEALLRALLEPPGQQVQRHQRDGEHQRAPRVEADQGDRDEDHVEHARHEPVDARVEEIPDRLEVAGLPRDDPARRVALVELQAELLGMLEDPPAQVDQDRLGDPGRQHRELRDQHRAEHAGDQVGADDQADRHPVMTLHQGRKPLVDADRDERRPRHLQRRADHDHEQRQHHSPAQRTQQRAEQPQRARPDGAALVAAVLRALLALHPSDGRHRVTSSSSLLSSSSDEMTYR